MGSKEDGAARQSRAILPRGQYPQADFHIIGSELAVESADCTTDSVLVGQQIIQNS